MWATYAFDICFERYCQARVFLEQKIGTVNIESAEDGLWRPGARARLADYVADFALAGQHALASPRLASRLILFRVYYLGRADYHAARRFLGISERTFADWMDQVREIVGRELLRRRVFPLRSYFRDLA